jgi:poly(beta-D-mannuronate) lyase
MLRLLVLKCCLLFSVITMANTITVKNIDELKKANKDAKAGDIIVLQNGVWNDVTIELNCSGTREQPITFKAQEAGKVLIGGHSQLKLGGNFIVVDGFYFTNGYAGDDAVIDFRIDKKQLANNCRVTNSAINDFNNPKRLDENYWVSFSGKNNRIDHCSFLNKKNMGVLVAVILDDDRSRENFHSIDHNYFGVRLPLASNSGEIIRIGVSQHCEFNSNTQITDNFFEHCDGETEIISVKSCRNVVRNNLFKECQGGVVLRHGHYNTVESNIFLGNDKAGTGGVRIINRGQWVVNNLFYKCRGVGFRSPLSIMNGVPNSPAFRYVAVTGAVVSNNSFYNCTPISLCEGSDSERTVTPHDVYFANNIFYNDRDSRIYNAYDDISGIAFASNIVSPVRKMELTDGFYEDKVQNNQVDKVVIPLPYPRKTARGIPDSLMDQSKSRLTTTRLNFYEGFHGDDIYLKIKQNAYNNCGVTWAGKLTAANNKSTVHINCKDGAALEEQLQKNYPAPVIITLTGNDYEFARALTISGNVTITSNKKPVRFVMNHERTALDCIEIKGGSTFSLVNCQLELSNINAGSFITADLNGSSAHSNLAISGCTIKNLHCDLFNAAKSTVFDSIIIKNNSFFSNKGTLFNFNNETDKKGYYNVEQLKITNNFFNGNEGQLLGMIRSGNDESTMGPLLLFKNNVVDNCNSKEPLVSLYGTQISNIEYNRFMASNATGTLVQYEDAVRAVHMINNNSITKSGAIVTDKFVTNKNNNIK